MPLLIVRNDITAMKVDAIVNAANKTLLGGGGVDGAIHMAAGPKLLEECKTLGGCETGEAKITAGYNLPAKYVIHTVGPIWRDGLSGEMDLLSMCYKNSLNLAISKGIESIAFPLISAGAYRVPKDLALSIAINTIEEFLESHEMTVYMVVFDRGVISRASELYKSIEEFIDDNYVEEKKQKFPRFFGSRVVPELEEYPCSEATECMPTPSPMPSYNMAPSSAPKAKAGVSKSLSDALKHMDDSFVQSLLKIIDSKGLKDSEVYKKANIDRKLFSKIRKDIYYKPKKTTALALAIALELSLEETESLIKKAGYALSSSSKFDIIVKYFIINKEYRINEINMVLFSYDLPILGSY